MVLAQVVPNIGGPELPLWVQLVAGAIGFAIAAYALVSGHLKKLSDPYVSKDVIVPTMTIADSKSIQALAQELAQWQNARRYDHEILKDILDIQRETVGILRDMKTELLIANRMTGNRSRT